MCICSSIDGMKSTQARPVESDVDQLLVIAPDDRVKAKLQAQDGSRRALLGTLQNFDAIVLQYLCRR